MGDEILGGVAGLVQLLVLSGYHIIHMFCLPFYSFLPDQPLQKTRKNSKKCANEGCRYNTKLDKPNEGHRRRKFSKTHFDKTT